MWMPVEIHPTSVEGKLSIHRLVMETHIITGSENQNANVNQRIRQLADPVIIGELG